MSKRNIEKHILMNKAEAQDLQKKAKRACLSEGGLIRLLLRGYEPREKPDERFYDVMRELSAIGNNINQLAAKANTLGFVDAPQLKKEAERWHKFQADAVLQNDLVCSTLLFKISVDNIDTKLFCDLVRVTSTATVNELVDDFHNFSRSVIPQSGSPPIL